MKHADQIKKDRDFWKKVEKDTSIRPEECHVIYKDERRIYISKNYVYKINIHPSKSISSSENPQNLHHEFCMMNRASSATSLSKPILYKRRENYEYLISNTINGDRFDRYNGGIKDNISINIRIVFLLLRMSLKGIVHGDVVHHNIIVSGNKVSLIDFGHSRATTVCKALLLNFLLKKGHPDFNRPYLVVLIRSIEFSLPLKFRGVYRKLLGIGPYIPEY